MKRSYWQWSSVIRYVQIDSGGGGLMHLYVFFYIENHVLLEVLFVYNLIQVFDLFGRLHFSAPFQLVYTPILYCLTGQCRIRMWTNWNGAEKCKRTNTVIHRCWAVEKKKPSYKTFGHFYSNQIVNKFKKSTKAFEKIQT